MIVIWPEVLAGRRQLSDVSWWIRCTAENIAVRAHREDEYTGRFWEGRFKLQFLLDEASLLAYAANFDLNPVRAAIAETLETSGYTGTKDRIDDLTEREVRTRASTRDWERSRRRHRSGWMSPIKISEQSDPVGPCPDRSDRHASVKGFLTVSLTRYVELLDWTGGQLHAGKVEVIPEPVDPILSRIGLDAIGWCDVVAKFGQMFKRTAGTSESLAQEAIRSASGGCVRERIRQAYQRFSKARFIAKLLSNFHFASCAHEPIPDGDGLCMAASPTVRAFTKRWHRN